MESLLGYENIAVVALGVYAVSITTLFTLVVTHAGRVLLKMMEQARKEREECATERRAYIEAQNRTADAIRDLRIVMEVIKERVHRQ